ncbi:hypothetical protein LEP3755_63700 (plasmid) [Leptolyngbya sp. NIES-3755]|nr:hypothetical protein LEP3755_63700 [Leptolyngbya sp. NIES-3755]
MKLKSFVVFFFGVLLTIVVGSAVVKAQSTGQPTVVNITLAPQAQGEYRIESSMTTFSKGVPYRFSIRNAGKKPHEFAIMPPGKTDTRLALLEIEEDELLPNSAATRDFTFSKAGDLEFACHFGNHYSKGMMLPITVR